MTEPDVDIQFSFDECIDVIESLRLASKMSWKNKAKLKRLKVLSDQCAAIAKFILDDYEAKVVADGYSKGIPWSKTK